MFPLNTKIAKKYSFSPKAHLHLPVIIICIFEYLGNGGVSTELGMSVKAGASMFISIVN